MNATSPTAPQHCLGSNPEWSPALVEELLPLLRAYLPQCRWFGGKGREITRLDVRASFPNPEDGRQRILLLEVSSREGSPELYAVPLCIGPAERAPDDDVAVVARFRYGIVLADALYRPAFQRRLLELIGDQETWRSNGDALTGCGTGVHEASGSRLLGGEQSNSMVVFDDSVALKFLRRIEWGPHPDAEILRALAKANFPHVPRYLGEIRCRLGGKEGVLALASSFVPNARDGWRSALEQADRFLRGGEHAEYPARARQLGHRTGELHVALAGIVGEAFEPEKFSAASREELECSLGALVRQSRDDLQRLLPELPNAAVAQRWLQASESVGEIFAAVLRQPTEAIRTRVHGDYHLGQVLDTGDDFVIIDFEGEPRRPLAERLRKRSPIVDVAGMLRSFDYAAATAAREIGAADERATAWTVAVRDAFLEGYLSAIGGTVVMPASVEEFHRLLRLFLLEKAIYEIGYEVNYRPHLVEVPLRAALRLQQGLSHSL